MIKSINQLTFDQVGFLVNFYDGFNFNFSRGYCEVEVDSEEEFNHIMSILSQDFEKEVAH